MRSAQPRPPTALAGTRRHVLQGVAALAAMRASSSYAAASFPARPIELIVPWGPGGGADQLGRKVAQLWEPILGVSLPVINVPGASGVTGLTKMLTAPADGYAVSVITADTLGLLAKEGQSWGLDDLAPLGVLIQQTSLFFVAPESGLASWAEVVEAARSRELKVAITGFGTADDQTVAYYRAKGLRLTSVPYAKPGERYTAVIGGNADLLYEQAGDVRSLIEGGRLRPVLHFAEARGAFPDVPTAPESGDQLTFKAYRGIIARAGTPPEVLAKLTDTLASAAGSADFKSYLDQQYAAPDSALFGPAVTDLITRELAAAKKFASL